MNQHRVVGERKSTNRRVLGEDPGSSARRPRRDSGASRSRLSQRILEDARRGRNRLRTIRGDNIMLRFFKSIGSTLYNRQRLLPYVFEASRALAYIPSSREGSDTKPDHIRFCRLLAPLICLVRYSRRPAVVSRPPMRPKPGRGTTRQVKLSSLRVRTADGSESAWARQRRGEAFARFELS